MDQSTDVGGMLSILIADDCELIRMALREILESRAGWKVCCEAADGNEAVAKAADLKPDVAILDVRMPGLGGIEAARQIRTASPATEILVLTGYDSEQVTSNAVAAGASAVVLKGEHSAQVISAVEALACHRAFIGPGSSRPAPAEGEPARARPVPSARRLTPRQREIAQFLAEGKTNWCVATILGISVKTVETHRSAIFEKLDLESVVELVHYAIRNFMIDP